MEEVSPEDSFLEKAGIHSLRRITAANAIQLESLESGIDICNGGVPLNCMLLAPYVAPDARVEWADFGKPGVQNAARFLDNAGNTQQRWLHHQTHMGTIDPLWHQSITQAVHTGVATHRDIMELPRDEFGFGATAFGPESITSNREEWEEAVMRLFRSVRIGGIVLMQYMIKSTGYASAGEHYRAVPITRKDVLELARDELRDIESHSVYKAQVARIAGEPFSYEGMGLLLGIRK